MGMGEKTTEGAVRISSIVVVLTLLTGGHGVLRSARSGFRPPEPRRVSRLRVGDTLPQEFLGSLPRVGGSAADRLIQGSQLLIVEDPTCAHCRSAAERWGDNGGWEGNPAIWITEEESSGTGALKQLLPAQDRVAPNPDLISFLQVEAVPAAFLVSRCGEILRVAPFSGTETEADLAEASTAPGGSCE